MRNPRRKRNLALLGLAGGVAALAGIVALPDAAQTGAIETVIGMAAITVAIFGLIGGLLIHGDARRQGRLLSGVDLLARWKVDPERWRAFVALNDRLKDQAGALPNALSVRREPPARGVDVIVGKQAVQVDGDFHSFGKSSPSIYGVTRRAGPPPCVEFDLLYSGGDGPDLRVCLRFPIGSGAEAEAARVLAHFSRR